MWRGISWWFSSAFPWWWVTHTLIYGWLIDKQWVCHFVSWSISSSELQPPPLQSLCSPLPTFLRGRDTAPASTPCSTSSPEPVTREEVLTSVQLGRPLSWGLFPTPSGWVTEKEDLLQVTCYCSVAQSLPTLHNPMDRSTPGFPVLHHLLEFAQTCSLSQWCHLTISSSVVPFSSCPQTFPASVFSNESALCIRCQRTGVSPLASVLPMNIQDWSPLGWTGWISLQYKGLSRVFSIPRFKSINSLALRLLYDPTLTSVHDYWKNHSFNYMALCWQSNVCNLLGTYSWAAEQEEGRRMGSAEGQPGLLFRGRSPGAHVVPWFWPPRQWVPTSAHWGGWWRASLLWAVLPVWAGTLPGAGHHTAETMLHQRSLRRGTGEAHTS